MTGVPTVASPTDRSSRIAALLAVLAWPLSLVYGAGSLLGLVAVSMASRDLRRRPDDRRAFGTVVLGFGAMVFGGCILSALLVEPGDRVAGPDVMGSVASGSWTTLDGRPIELASGDGRPTIVDVWATWCPPCVAGIPTLEAFHRDLADEFRIVSFAVEPSSKVSGWLESRRSRIAAGDLSPLSVPTYPIVARDGPMPAIVDATRAYPTLWILAEDGTVLQEIVGMHDPMTLLARIRAASMPAGVAPASTDAP